MPTIDQINIDSPVTQGQPADITLASTATNGGTLSGNLHLSPNNDVFFGAPPNKNLAANPNGTSPFIMVRGDGKTSPRRPVVFITVSETGAPAAARAARGVILVP